MCLFILILVRNNVFLNKCEHREWVKCTSKCLKDNNKASHFFGIVDIFFDGCIWGLMLQEYNLIMKHIKSNDNCIANVLSRVR
jgi:hypothetical protein